MTDNPFFRSTTPADPKTSNPVDPVTGSVQTQPTDLNASPPTNLPGAQPVTPPVMPDNANAPLNDLSQAISAQPTDTSPPIMNPGITNATSDLTTNTNEVVLPQNEVPTANLTEPVIPAQEPIVESSAPDVPSIPEILAMPSTPEAVTPNEAVTKLPEMPEINTALQTESVAPVSEMGPLTTSSTEMDTVPQASNLPESDNMLTRANESSASSQDELVPTLNLESSKPLESGSIPETVLPSAATDTEMKVDPVVAPLASTISDIPTIPSPVAAETVTLQAPEPLTSPTVEAQATLAESVTPTSEQSIPSLADPMPTVATETENQMNQAPVAPIADTITPLVSEGVAEALPEVDSSIKNSEVVPVAPTATTSPAAEGKMKNLLLLLGLLIVGIIALVLGIIVASAQ